MSRKSRGNKSKEKYGLKEDAGMHSNGMAELKPIVFFFPPWVIDAHTYVSVLLSA